MISYIQAWLILISILIFKQVIAAPIEPQTENALTSKMILYYINDYRLKHHLPPFKMNSVISQEAEKHSHNMAVKAVSFGHEHFNARIKRLYQRIGDCRGGAENVAYYKLNAKRLVDAWLSSPGHRKNIEGNYNLTGIGIAYGKKGWAYYTQIFLRVDNKRYA